MKSIIITAIFLIASEAKAEIFYVTPFIGGEYVSGATASLSLKTGTTTASIPSAFGLAFGAQAGFALGPARLGVLYQRTEMLGSAEAALNYNKLFAELGLAFRLGIVGLGGSVAGGWAFLSSGHIQRQDGAGGRVGAFVDFYIGDWFSIGPGASFDFAGYFTPSGVFGTYGFTGALRIGLHI